MLSTNLLLLSTSMMSSSALYTVFKHASCPDHSAIAQLHG